MFEIIGKYTKAIVYNDNIEEEAIAQIYSIVNCKAYEDQTIRIMPDTHCGKGSVIGFCSTFGKYIDPRTVGVDIGCFTENTKVQLTDNRQLSFKELIDEYNNGKENFCYAINENGNICITKINLPKYIKTVDNIIKITLDNNQSIECTLDHLFMLRNGEYKEAQNLSIGESLMPLYIDTCLNQYNNMDHKPKGHNMDPYLVIYDPKINKYRYIHFLADEYNNGNSKNGTIRHHIDFNKLNNNPSNIKRMFWKDHWKIHYDHVSETNKLGLTGFKRANELHPGLYSYAGHIGMTKNHNTPGFTEKCRQNIINCNKYGKNKEYANSKKHIDRITKMGKSILMLLKKHPNYYDKLNLTRSINQITDMINDKLDINKDSFAKYKRENKSYFNAYSYDKLFTVLKKYGYEFNDINLEKIRDIRDNIIISINDIETDLDINKIKNHKIKNIEIIHNPNTKVYCLVEQQYNNFALAAGVFVHNCEISMHLYDRPIPQDKYAELNHKILKECGWGFNLSPKKMYEDKELYKFMSTEFRKAKSRHPEIFAGLPDTVTEKWVMDMLNRIGMDPKTWYYSINSFGGGNHYCEYDEGFEPITIVDRTPIGADNNGNTIWCDQSGDYYIERYGITVHCGSRNFGVKVCKYWENKSKGAALSKAEMKEYTNEFKKTYLNTHESMKNFKNDLNKYLESKKEDHIEGFLTGDNMNGYFCDMYTAKTYARFNHIILHRTIDNIVAKYGCKVTKEIVSTHNYIDFDEDTPIIRNGAIRAYEGEEMLVPFNMRDGVAICEGLSNSDWLNSCAHGAGRKMSRSKAKENVSMDEFKESMKNVYSTTVCRGTIDESPMAYKDTNEIKDLIQRTCKIKYMMIPKINIKAADGGD